MKLKFTLAPLAPLAPLALLMLAGCSSKAEPTLTAPETVGTTATTAATTPVAAPASTTAPAPTDKSMTDMKPTAKGAAGAGTTDVKKFRVRGEVTGVEKSADGRMTLIVKHEDIPNFMPAMEMRMPFANNADASKVKASDKIAFDMQRSNLEISNFKVLPPATQLKLKK